MTRSFLIGLDYGSESARGVLIDAASGHQVESHVHAYRHGILTRTLPDGTPLSRGWALQVAADYLEAAADILTVLGGGRQILSIGAGFTASSPLPATETGTPLSEIHPGNPHAYVKLWKHRAAQPYADAINKTGGGFLANFGGKLSGEWLLAKAAQIEAEAPDIWAETGRFIEGGDWLVWQLTGIEARGLGLAAYKAQYSTEAGYPSSVVAGLAPKLAPPLAAGATAGALTESWRQKTGIEGPAIVSVATIDSHVVLPAIHAVSSGCLVGALGTSAAYLLLSDEFRPLPAGIEGVAKDGAVRGLWCYEAGQASFGDTLSWFVKTFPRGASEAESFAAYNREAAALAPAANSLLALDWWNGNRVPFADSELTGLLLGLSMETTAVDIYRALMEALCHGARNVVGRFEAAGFAIERILMTSGLARNNPELVAILADILERVIEVPEIEHPTAVGAAIHGAVAAGIVASFQDGAARFGARAFKTYEPRAANAAAHRALYQHYQNLSADAVLHAAMHDLGRLASTRAGGASDR
ncbi:FGGY-family carbohydrate kinase [Kaistia granuli]|uniref:FGGY-family carbohydrate kinase n=1 Tax=Kaistia granuli TaxID=363259 RepID=UPI00037FF6F9|nr:FGGY-family carbohydrate kinase [Kaistia granuli]